MPSKRFSLEQIIAKLREGGEAIGRGIDQPADLQEAADLGPDVLLLASRVLLQSVVSEAG
jgi:hypothetical protein